MSLNRREFIRSIGVAGVGTATVAKVAEAAAPPVEPSVGAMGVLVNIPNCIGCRKCEFACRQNAGFACPPIESFDDKRVFDTPRRPGPTDYTVVNRFENPGDPDKPVFAKVNCLHCVDPACASACLVGALRKQDNGPVIYDPWKCMGCRYCMVACPFQIPAYEYDNAFTPQVRKCTFCFDRISEEGGVPACVKICPQECLTFGRRDELLSLAHERIAAHTDKYVDRVYGEHEVGGTSWLYLSSVPFEQLGFLSLGSTAPPRLTEAIQHGVFKNFFPPLALYALLGVIMRLTRREQPDPTAIPLPVIDQQTNGKSRDGIRHVAGSPEPRTRRTTVHAASDEEAKS